ncbi:MAG: LysE family transporter [Bacteroidales bacterium]|nr:LysE family transporter [Bacteroidales bacterium]
MTLDFLKSVLVGICLAAPIGPVVITVMQKSLSYGRKTGFKAAMGCAVMDTVYATLSFIALAFIKGFLDQHKVLIAILGGCVIISLGIIMFLSDPYKNGRSEETMGTTAFWQVALIILTNPGSILYDFTVCTFFGLQAKDWKLLLLAAGVFLGELLFWTLLTWIFGRLRRSLTKETLIKLSKASGLLLAVCGVVILLRGIL